MGTGCRAWVHWVQRAPKKIEIAGWLLLSVFFRKTEMLRYLTRIPWGTPIFRDNQARSGMVGRYALASSLANQLYHGHECWIWNDSSKLTAKSNRVCTKCFQKTFKDLQAGELEMFTWRLNTSVQPAYLVTRCRHTKEYITYKFCSTFLPHWDYHWL